MKFFKPDVKISSTSPPEEILNSLAGSCGRWQITVTAFSMVAVFLGTLDRVAVLNSVPLHLNFTCADGNGSQCEDANGTTCEKFTFFKEYKTMITFTEKLNLVCEREVYAAWIRNCYRVGLAIGYMLTGSCASKFGIKVTTALFVSLHCFTGLLVISVSSEEILIFFMFFAAVFSASILCLPSIIVCDAVGNKWRTFAMGVVFSFRPVGSLVSQLIQNAFKNVQGILATVSVLPLIVLIPLLYYKESPNNMPLMTAYSKGEKTLREIAEINRCPISSSIKIRPVQILNDNHMPQRPTFCEIWKPVGTRHAYLALVYISYCMGLWNGILFHYAPKDKVFGYLNAVCQGLGCVLCITLMHFVPHRIIIGISEFLKCIFVSTLLMCGVYSILNESMLLLSLTLSAAFVEFLSLTTLDNIIPRMFPTELRSLGLGLCLGVYHLAHALEVIAQFYYKPTAFYGTFSILFLSFILEMVACFWLWNVHKRELPDFLEDCVNFNTFYKPTRYFSILDNASQHEIEVIQVNLSTSPRTNPPKKTKFRKTT